MIKGLINNYFFKSKLSLRLLFLTLLFSTLITLFITLLQLYVDYKNGYKSINNQFSAIETSYIDSITQSIWVYDVEQTKIQLSGITNLPDIEYVHIKLASGEKYEEGVIVSSNYEKKEFPLNYEYNSQKVELGKITVVADLSILYNQLIDKVGIIIMSQGVKTFLTSFFILFIFGKLVTQHIFKIAEYTKNLDIQRENEKTILQLDKDMFSYQYNELDDLVQSINTMQSKLQTTFDDLNSELHARMSAEKLLLEYKKALDASAYVSKADLAGNIIYVNDALCEKTGYTKEELIGEPHNIFRDKESPKKLFINMWETIQNKKIWTGTVKNRTKNGDAFYTILVIVPILNTEGEIVEYIASRRDITELIERKEELERLYKTDPLTQLGNRVKLINDINSSIQPALTIIDIDDFKEINDFYGDEIGNNVIIEFGNRLNKYAQELKFDLYRLHADQFAILYTKREKDAVENSVKELMIKVLQKPITLENNNIFLQATSGASFGKENLFIHADMALKIAKKEKRNYLIYDQSFNVTKQYEENIKWTNKLRVALDENRVVAFYQPIFNTKTQKIEKFESLVRMIDKNGKIISPFFFLDVAIKSKQYFKITKLMIDAAIKAAQNYNYEFSVNFSVDDILNKEIKEYFIDSVTKYNIAEKIVVELVESEAMEDQEAIYEFIVNIKKLGCKLAIDDFGTGYSNFDYILKLDADYIKIDGSLIKNIDTNDNVKLIAKSIISFANIANMKTIAEFVSKEEIHTIVSEIGADYLQGYYISEPIPYDEIKKFS